MSGEITTLRGRNPIFQSKEQAEYNRLRALWRAVIMQGVQDAATQSKKPENRKIKIDAQKWIGSDDFADVCSLGDYDYSYALKKCDAAIERRQFVPTLRRRSNHN